MILSEAVTQTPKGMLERVLEMAFQSGFTAVLLLIILWFGREELRGLGARIIEQGKEIAQALSQLQEELKEVRRAQDRNTKMVTIALLQLATLVPGAKEQLQDNLSEIESVNARDKK